MFMDKEMLSMIKKIKKGMRGIPPIKERTQEMVYSLTR